MDTLPRDPSSTPHQPWKGALEWVRRAVPLLTADGSPEDIAERGVRLAAEAIACDFAVLEVLDPDTGELSAVARFGQAGDLEPFDRSHPMFARMFQSRESVSAVSPTPLVGARRTGSRAQLVAPLVVRDDVRGALTIERIAPDPFLPRDEAILSMFGLHVAASLETQRLFGEMQRSEARLRKMFVASWDGIATVARSGAVTSLSGHFFRSTGLAPEALVGEGWLSVVKESDQEDVRRALARAAEGGRELCRFSFKHAKGHWGIAEAAFSPLDPSDDACSVIAAVRDVTENLSREDRLRDAEKLAAVGRLIGALAHDLNGPLAAILGLSQVLALEATEEEIKNDLAMMERQATLAAGIVGELLWFVHKRKPEPRVVDVNQLVEDVAIRCRERLSSRGVHLDLDLAAGIPPIGGDPIQLDRALFNLIRNAEDALLTREGVRRIRVRTCAQGRVVQIEISDNGPGVPAELTELVFEPLFSTKEAGKGTGFGLAIARDTARAHGGSLVLRREGPGATFVIELPAGDVSALRPTGEHAVAQAPARPLDVLIVDDDDAVRRAVRRYLTRRGHQVTEAANGEEGMALLEHGRRFDRILLDNRMPGMSGPQFLQALTRYPGITEKVILITGDVLSPDARALVQSSGLPHLPKPFDLTDLAQLIEEPRPTPPERGAASAGP